MITYEAIRDACAEAYRRNLQVIPQDVKDALKIAVKNETTPDAIWAINGMIDAADAACKENMTMCEDTGRPTYDIRIGTQVGEIPDDFEKAIAEGHNLCFENMGFRAGKLIHPIDRSEVDLPIIQIFSIPGKDYIDVIATPKGGGTEPKSSTRVFDPITPAVFKKWAVDYIANIGGMACPPYIVGLGIGGSVAVAGNLALEATLRPVNDWHPNPKVAQWEKEITDAINGLGIGPMGMGGKTSCLAAHIELGPSFSRWSGVSLNLKCWPNRRGVIRVYKDNRMEPVEVERHLGIV